MTVPPTESGEGDPGQVTRIAEELIRLHEAGQLTDLDEFCARYPEDQRDQVRQECEQLLRIQGVIMQPDRLSPGQTLASYKIVEQIGKGGMGEVSGTAYLRARRPSQDRNLMDERRGRRRVPLQSPRGCWNRRAGDEEW